MSNTRGNLEDEVAKWLESQGYPLEMEVASEFQKNGFKVHQSSYFNDPDTGKSREIDVVATKVIYTGDTFAVIRFVIECKSSKNKPWVVFTRDNEVIDFEYSNWYVVNQRGWDYMLHSSIAGKLEKHELSYHKGIEIGYGITQAFTSGEDVTFKALNSVAKCAVAYIEVAKSKKYDVVEIVIPIIVIEGDLLEARLKKGKLNTRRTEESVVQWDTVIGDKAGFTIYIVSRNTLSSFVVKAGKMADRICEDWKENLEEILYEMQNLHDEIPE